MIDLADDYLPMSTLDLLITRGWGDTPREKIPADWLQRQGPGAVHAGRPSGACEDPGAAKRARLELVALRMRQRNGMTDPAENGVELPRFANGRRSRQFAKPRLSRHWTDRRAEYLTRKLGA